MKSQTEKTSLRKMNRMTPESIKSIGNALCAFWSAAILNRANAVITQLMNINDFKTYIIPMAAEVVTIIAMYSLFRNRENFKSDNLRLCTLFICFMQGAYFIFRALLIIKNDLFESMSPYFWFVCDIVYLGLIIAVLCGLRTTVNIKTIGYIAFLAGVAAHFFECRGCELAGEGRIEEVLHFGINILSLNGASALLAVVALVMTINWIKENPTKQRLTPYMS